MVVVLGSFRGLCNLRSTYYVIIRIVVLVSESFVGFIYLQMSDGKLNGSTTAVTISAIHYAKSSS